ncbi:MAG: extensin family protein [Hyphomicrobiaceae bacterium]
MIRARSAVHIASFGVLTCLALASFGDQPLMARDNTGSKDKEQTAEDPSKSDAKGESKTRKGVRIELTVPRIPGISGKSWPKTIPDAEAEKKADGALPEKWSPEEIAAAKAHCTAVLSHINAIAIPQEPIKEGGCGTPAPIQLISIGRNPEVALSPPAIVNCDFAEALNDWVTNDVQPLAVKNFSNKVIKIEVMSSYSCRTAYGRKGNKLSEHAVANALDIRGFVTAGGRQAYVLEHWGTPQREILARIAEEKAKAAKALAEAQAAEKAAQTMQAGGKPSKETPPSSTASSAGEPGGGVARSTIVDGTPKLTITLPGASPGGGAGADSGFSMAPSRLGGPKSDEPSNGKSVNVAKAAAKTGKTTQTKAADKPKPPQKEARLNDAERKEAFLHAVHASACQRFGTTLGPEANSAHRNHFHVDMAPRKKTKICD